MTNIETFFGVTLSFLAVLFFRRGRRPSIFPHFVYLPIALCHFMLDRHFLHGFPPEEPVFRLSTRLLEAYGLYFPIAHLIHDAIAVRRRNSILTVLSLVALALSVWALMIEPSRLVVREIEIRDPRAPKRGLDILHISDLQTDGPCLREKKARDQIQTLAPDLVVFTGDIINDPDQIEGRSDRIRAAHDFFLSLHAPHGVFIVLGDWDGWASDWDFVLKEIIEGTEARVLRNEAVSIEIDGDKVLLWGVLGGEEEAYAVPEVPDLTHESGLRIIAVHDPDWIFVPAPGREYAVFPPDAADIVLAGHTHGGQVSIPFYGPLTTHTELNIEGGVAQVRGTTLVVSRGIGMRGLGAPRIRFGVPPEIGIVRVRR